MSSASKINRIVEIKIMLQKVIRNLKILENNQINHFDQTNCDKQIIIKESITHLLNKLETLPLESIKKQMLKRHKHRKRQKNQVTRIISASTFPNSSQNAAVQLDNINALEVQSDVTSMHYYRMALKVGERFLSLLNLLERLHFLRGRNQAESHKFGQKLRELKKFWHEICLEKENCFYSPTEQWNRVLFGQQKKFTVKKSSLKDLLRKRTVWDSYIDLKRGTPLPLGWVTPPNSPNAAWSKYITY